MNVTSARVILSALGTFFPTAPGATKEQVLGVEKLSLDIPGMTLIHETRLSITNFGTGGETITVNGQTQEVTFGEAAVGTAVRGAGLNYDGADIAASRFNLILFRVISSTSDDEEQIQLISDSGSAEFRMRADLGGFALQVIKGEAGIPHYGDWVVKGPVGLQDGPFVIEILVFGS